MSHTPSPRSKARSTRAKVAIRCDVSFPLTSWLTVWLAKLARSKAARLKTTKQRGSNEMCRLSGRHETAFYFRPPHCQHTIIARCGPDLYPVHPHAHRNVWTQTARVLRQTPAIL